jgi:hypothetical protein
MIQRLVGATVAELHSYSGALSCHVARVPRWKLLSNAIATPVAKRIHHNRLQFLNIFLGNFDAHAVGAETKLQTIHGHSDVIFPNQKGTVNTLGTK